MRGFGFIINSLAVIVGGIIGLFLKKGMPERFQEILTKACGISTVFIGAAGCLAGMLSAGEDGVLSTQGSMLLILSLVIGGLLGEACRLEDRLDGIGEKLKKRFGSEEDNRFVEGFVAASVIVCVGAMAIVGSIQDGMSGDVSMILTKSVLDFVILIVLASAYGLGAIFSGLAIFVYQGLWTLLGVLAGNFMTEAMISEFSYVGSSLIFCIGINLLFGKKIKTGNYLPALLIPILYEIIRPIFG